MTDLSKLVQTRDGRPAAIISTNGVTPGFPLIVLVTGPNGDSVIHLTKDGKAYEYPGEHAADLVNVPPKTFPRTVYLNLGHSYDSYDEAKKSTTYDWSVLKLKLNLTNGLEPGGVHEIVSAEIVDA